MASPFKLGRPPALLAHDDAATPPISVRRRVRRCAALRDDELGASVSALLALPGGGAAAGDWVALWPAGRPELRRAAVLRALQPAAAAGAGGGGGEAETTLWLSDAALHNMALRSGASVELAVAGSSTSGSGSGGFAFATALSVARVRTAADAPEQAALDRYGRSCCVGAVGAVGPAGAGAGGGAGGGAAADGCCSGRWRRGSRGRAACRCGWAT